MDLWREIAAQGYPGSYRMVYRFLETLKTTQQVTTTGTQRLPQYPSKAAIWLFMRRFKDLDEQEQNDLMAFRQASSTLATTYDLVQDFLQMVRERQGDRLEEWLTQVEKSALPELESFAHGVQKDHAAVHLSPPIFSEGLYQLCTEEDCRKPLVFSSLQDSFKHINCLLHQKRNRAKIWI